MKSFYQKYIRKQKALNYNYMMQNCIEVMFFTCDKEKLDKFYEFAKRCIDSVYQYNTDRLLKKNRF